MSDITKKMTYSELGNKEYQALFKFTNGETVLGVINYDNGDVYMGEIKPDEKYDGKRDRRRHGYGKVFPKRGKVVDGEWYLGQVIGKSVTFDKKGKRTVEVRGSNPSFRSILYSYYLTDDNKYGGDNYNGLYKDEFWEGDFKDVLCRGELREQLFNGTVPKTTPSTSAQKSAPTKEKAPAEKSPAKKSEMPKESASKAKNERKEFKNGDVYEGEYKDGKFHGQGKYTSSKGWVYEGQFTDGQMTGKGKITYASGTVYEGDWIKGIRNGYGRITYTDGLYYEGGWKDDQRHGKSTYTQKLGEFTLVHTGMWDMGKRTGAHDHYSITNPEKKIYRQFYDNDEAVGSQFCPVGAYANWTVADAVANAKRMEEENRQFWEDKKAREAAHSRSSSTSRRFADSSDVDKAKKNGTVFTEWASIDPSMFNEVLAVSHEGCLVDMDSEILKQEQEHGYYYMKYHTARDGKKVTLYLFFYDEVIQEDYVCTDASMNHTELVKRKIYLCLPRGAGFSKKEIYVDCDGNQIGNSYLFATDVVPGINELADCISLLDEKWEFAGTLSPDGQYTKY